MAAAAAGLPLLCGCTAVDTPEACRLTPVAELPVQVVANLPLLDVTADGKPARFMLDTGAEASAISEDGFARLALEHDYRLPTYATGLGARGSNWATQPVKIILGNATLEPSAMLVIRLAKQMPFDGMIGSLALSAYDVDLEMPRGRLTLYKRRRCPGGPPPFAPSTTLPAQASGPYRLRVPVTIDSTPLWLDVDTGASRTVVDATRMRLGEPELAGDPGGRLATADPVGLLVHRHRFRSLTVGGETIAAPAIMTGDLRRTGHDGLLGTDYWHNRRIWISYGSRTVTVGPPE